MGKLHELLAVEPDLKAEAQRAASQIMNLFSEGKGRLIGQIKTYRSLEEDDEGQPDEITELATTVQAELEATEIAYGAWIDAAIQKEATNQTAASTVIINGKSLFGNRALPVTALLNLESKLVELRRIYNAIPTNDPTEKWEWDEQTGCYISRERCTYRTRKVPRTHVLYEATAEHPAQTELYHEDIRVGQYITTIRSGMLTPSEKRSILMRIDQLGRAVKAARQKANDIEIKDIHIAKELFSFLRGE